MRVLVEVPAAAWDARADEHAADVAVDVLIHDPVLGEVVTFGLLAEPLLAFLDAALPQGDELHEAVLRRGA